MQAGRWLRRRCNTRAVHLGVRATTARSERTATVQYAISASRACDDDAGGAMQGQKELPLLPKRPPPTQTAPPTVATPAFSFGTPTAPAMPAGNFSIGAGGPPQKSKAGRRIIKAKRPPQIQAQIPPTPAPPRFSFGGGPSTPTLVAPAASSAWIVPQAWASPPSPFSTRAAPAPAAPPAPAAFPAPEAPPIPAFVFSTGAGDAPKKRKAGPLDRPADHYPATPAAPAASSGVPAAPNMPTGNFCIGSAQVPAPNSAPKQRKASRRVYKHPL